MEHVFYLESESSLHLKTFNAIIEIFEKKILLSEKNKSSCRLELVKNREQLVILKNTSSYFHQLVLDVSKKIDEAEKNGIRIGFHRGHQPAKEEMIGGIPDINFDKEGYRQYNILRVAITWPELT